MRSVLNLPEEIQRFIQKVKRDPTSRLFVPLAEEYAKIGMLDEALLVLTQGLAQSPNYLTARVSLAKVYLQKGMISKAREEFEKVVSVDPENILAQKKLARIYLDEGNPEEAARCCRAVLSLHPQDLEAVEIMEAPLRFSLPPSAALEEPAAKDAKRENTLSPRIDPAHQAKIDRLRNWMLKVEQRAGPALS